MPAPPPEYHCAMQVRDAIEEASRLPFMFGAWFANEKQAKRIFNHVIKGESLSQHTVNYTELEPDEGEGGFMYLKFTDKLFPYEKVRIAKMLNEKGTGIFWHTN